VLISILCVLKTLFAIYVSALGCYDGLYLEELEVSQTKLLVMFHECN
jgi:uncharacterized membrane protein